MDKNQQFYLTVIIGFLIIISGVFVFLNADFGAKNSIVRDNVEFVSDYETIEILNEIRLSKLFILSPEFVERGPENAFMVSVITIFSTVLIAKDKDVIVVGRVLDSNGNLIECQSNRGDVRTNEPIDLEECRQLISDPENVRILISLPDPSLSMSKVVLEPKTIRITPNSFEDVAHVSFVVVDSLYDDSEQIIENVNVFVENLG